VLEARPSESRVVVAGVNRHKWHVKPTREQAGHIVDREAPIHVSNVALVDPKTKKPTRVGYKVTDGKKVRVAKKSGVEL
jgi:large subunit ribosomal protein L24